MSRVIKLLAALSIMAALYAPSAFAETRLILASTTSTQNTGLFDVLLPAYYKWTKLKYIRVDVVAVGTGKAIETAKRGDADLLLMHDKEKEDAFVAEGYGVKRISVMYNEFVVVGPMADPAGVKSAKSASGAFKKIAAAGSVFVSRGDESGTHAKEKKIWKEAGVDIASIKGYLSVGQGMEATIRIADEKGAYTLSDKATYLTTLDSLKYIRLLYEGDPGLFNQYATIAVNPAKFPHTRIKEAQDFIAFITGPAGQKVIGGFRDKKGNPLFMPNAHK